MRDLFSPAALLKFFEKYPAKTFRLRQLMAELGLRSSQARELKGALRRLAGARKIVHLKQNQFTLAKESHLKEAEKRGGPAGRRSENPTAEPFGQRLANVI